MSKEKKKQASVNELRNGSCLLLLFSPIIGAAFLLMLSGVSSFLFSPYWQGGDNSALVLLLVPLAIMSYFLLRFMFRWRRLALFIKRVRDEYFRFMRMQEDVQSEPVVQEQETSEAYRDYLEPPANNQQVRQQK